ncbi:uncharacterized protein LOC130623066 [Hydractinia symbiolongicarpus]|uniref:uncharacterized protein LOC130623066 n=1 Tax=Hydractinia symbiolongicarpus TaxID=13093 RepID=UPI00254B3A08|nr:uncharacterized protein LOC130623066 [Hydractinia symbiolongicarpus]
MGIVNCAVVGCTRNSRQIDKWKKISCEKHTGQLHNICGCEPPFRLCCFPGAKQYKDKRNAFKPRRTLLGAPVPVTSSVKRKKTCEAPVITESLATSSNNSDNNNSIILFLSPPTSSAINFHENDYSLSENRCKINDCKVKLLPRNKKQAPFSWKQIKSDDKMNFYTGITSIKAFHTIFRLLYPYVQHMKYWHGSKQFRKKAKVRNVNWRFQPQKMTKKDEFLLTLMKLRLGLLNEDLADRFQISCALCSQTFQKSIRFLSATLGNALVKWIPKEAVLEHMPTVFKEKGYTKVRVILDCFESFIERSKSLEAQALAWSDYKHHNTIKFFVGISPTGYITYLFSCYGGRTSEKFIYNDSGFELMEYGDEVMADRGF